MSDEHAKLVAEMVGRKMPADAAERVATSIVQRQRRQRVAESLSHVNTSRPAAQTSLPAGEVKPPAFVIGTRG